MSDAADDDEYSALVAPRRKRKKTTEKKSTTSVSDQTFREEIRAVVARDYFNLKLAEDDECEEFPESAKALIVDKAPKTSLDAYLKTAERADELLEKVQRNSFNESTLNLPAKSASAVLKMEPPPARIRPENTRISEDLLDSQSDDVSVSVGSVLSSSKRRFLM